jgi:hypothetical protein
MNIFYVQEDPIKSAQELADQHILKMGIESAQMLSTAHWLTGTEAPYKKAHPNHPSTKWARESIQHYRWLCKHGLEILKEYTRRYGKVHKTESIMDWLCKNEPKLEDKGFVPPPQCMPEEFKDSNTVFAYRKFYVKDKIAVKNLTYNKCTPAPNWTRVTY